MSAFYGFLIFVGKMASALLCTLQWCVLQQRAEGELGHVTGRHRLRRLLAVFQALLRTAFRGCREGAVTGAMWSIFH